MSAVRGPYATWGTLGGLLLVAGLIVAFATEDATRAIATGVASAGAVILISLGFYAVGRSEDRERERTDRRD